MHKVYSILNIQSTVEALLLIMSFLFAHKKNNFLLLTIFFSPSVKCYIQCWILRICRASQVRCLINSCFRFDENFLCLSWNCAWTDWRMACYEAELQVLETGGQDSYLKRREPRSERIRSKSAKPTHPPETNFSNLSVNCLAMLQ